RVEDGPARAGQLGGVAGGVELVVGRLAAGIDAAGHAQALRVVGDEVAGPVVLPDHVAQTARIDEELRADAVVGAGHAIAQSVIFVGPGARGRDHAQQAALGVVNVALAAGRAGGGNQVPVGVENLAGGADRHVLVEVVDRVRGRHALIAHHRPVARGVVPVGDGPAPG